MGYETEFDGSFKIEPPLQGHHRAYLEKFFETRRMKRDAEKTKLRPDPLREAVGLPVGEEGCFFVNEEGFKGQGRKLSDDIDDVVDYNTEPKTQHGLWCGFRITDEGHLQPTDGKNYSTEEWLGYLIETFFKPWGYRLSGQVRWRGESFDDMGVMEVVNGHEVRTRGLS